MEKTVYILGYSGHSYSVIDAFLSNRINISGYFDIKEAITNPYKIMYLGHEDESLLKKTVKNDFIFPCIGSNTVRKRISVLLSKSKLNQTSIIHSNAYVCMNSIIGKSTVVCNGALINPNCMIGDFCIINTGAIIEHDCTIDNFAHIASGAVLAGNVTVKEMSFIGANASIKQGVTIGKNVIIGAGSVVLNDVPDDSVFVGNPAKYLRENV